MVPSFLARFNSDFVMSKFKAHKVATSDPTARKPATRAVPAAWAVSHSFLRASVASSVHVFPTHLALSSAAVAAAVAVSVEPPLVASSVDPPFYALRPAARASSKVPPPLATFKAAAAASFLTTKPSHLPVIVVPFNFFQSGLESLTV